MNGGSIALCANDSAKVIHQEKLDTGRAIRTQDSDTDVIIDPMNESNHAEVIMTQVIRFIMVTDVIINNDGYPHLDACV